MNRLWPLLCAEVKEVRLVVMNISRGVAGAFLRSGIGSTAIG